MSGSNGRKTIRLTMGQALVKYLSVQYSERDNRERRFIQAMFGIFGHGNVSGLGQALGEYAKELPYYQPKNEQAMVHTASGFAKTNLRLDTLACTSSIGPGATPSASSGVTRWTGLPCFVLPPCRSHRKKPRRSIAPAPGNHRGLSGTRARPARAASAPPRLHRNVGPRRGRPHV